MSRECELTGKKVLYGHKVSHSNRKSSRRFEPNLQVVSLYSETLKKNISLRVAANTIRSVDHNGGLDAFLVTAKAHNLTVEAAKLRRDIKKAMGDVPFVAKKRYPAKKKA
jgi:large subunit ribosomal protein L28